MRRKSGFTLVELLTVIGILALLIAILVPAVNQVRRQARMTTTSAGIATLATGVEQFRADARLGGVYPPSAGDIINTTPRSYRVGNPYKDAPSPGPDRIEISGAGLLVWALAGGDLLGSPGFRDLDDNGTWAEDTGNTFTGDPVDSKLHAIYPPNHPDRAGEPVHARIPPLVDLSTVKLSRWELGTRSFVIPREADTRGSFGQAPSAYPQRQYPMFLDAWGGPILYWRADRAGKRIADVTPVGTPANERGIYHFADNSRVDHPLLEDHEDALWLSAARNVNGGEPAHDLWLDAVGDSDLYDADELRTKTAEVDRKYFFARVIQNLDVTVRAEPQKPQGFLLLSSGADGIFGTTDDIGNFEPNGR